VTEDMSRKRVDTDTRGEQYGSIENTGRRVCHRREKAYTDITYLYKYHVPLNEKGASIFYSVFKKHIIISMKLILKAKE
jgi:hypothetical protein